MDLYILKRHKPVHCTDLQEWANWYEHSDRRLFKTMVGQIMVSTVFLCMDHRFDGEGLPVLFETMVFGGELDMEMDRYCTWQDAKLGHERIVRLVRESERVK